MNTLEMNRILSKALLGKQTVNLDRAGIVLTVGDGIARVFWVE